MHPKDCADDEKAGYFLLWGVAVFGWLGERSGKKVEAIPKGTVVVVVVVVVV